MAFATFVPFLLFLYVWERFMTATFVIGLSHLPYEMGTKLRVKIRKKLATRTKFALYWQNITLGHGKKCVANIFKGKFCVHLCVTFLKFGTIACCVL
jgi:hypothetical protein